jgi:hypothetical protein
MLANQFDRPRVSVRGLGFASIDWSSADCSPQMRPISTETGSTIW